MGCEMWLNGYKKTSRHSTYSLRKSGWVTTHCGLVTTYGVTDLCHHWFRWWLAACLAAIHDLNQCWVIVNWTFRNKFQWHFNQNFKFFIEENAFENVVCKMAAIFARPQSVNMEYLMDTKYGILVISLWCWQLQGISLSTFLPFHAGELDTSCVVSQYQIMVSFWKRLAFYFGLTKLQPN